MANKQFIRHLEFYGYPDQNGYSSEASCCDCVDLSEIIKKNKQQDREIACLTHEKAEKKDLDALSATVETVISAQSQINMAFADAISGMAEDIEALKEADEQFAEQLSAMTEDINEVTSGLSDAMCGIQILGHEIDDLSGTVEDLKETLENDYAKKDEVVTKDWIEEQGYLTVESGDSRYAKIEDLEDLADIVESATTGINDEIDEINEKLDDFSGKVTTEIDEINDKIDEFSGEVTTEIEEINDKIDELQEEVSANTEDIAELQEEVSANTEDIAELQDEVSAITDDLADLHEQVDANTEDIADLQDDVSAITENIEEIYDILDTKASISQLEELHNELTCEIERLDRDKADKTDLEFVSGAVDDLSDKLDAEIQRSSGVDETMQAEIDALSGDIATLSGQVEGLDNRIADVESGLTKEIADRKQADEEIIGTSSDTKDAITIYGARKYAEFVNRETLDDAKEYTDEKVGNFEAELLNLSAATDLKFSKYATKDYVDERCQVTEAEIKGELIPALSAETERATQAELNIATDLQILSGEVLNGLTEIAHNATRLNAITDWDGETPEDYPSWAATHPNAKGILDVLHREFHQLIDTLTQKGILP